MIKPSREGGKTFYYFLQIFLSVKTKHIWSSRQKLFTAVNTSSSGTGSEWTPEIYYKYQRPKGDELHLRGGRKESPKNKPQAMCHLGKLISLLPDRDFF